MTADANALPHALLFAGPPGVGKREIADALAARLLCESPRGSREAACGTCHSCLMMTGGQHPDFRLLQPEAAEESAEDASPEGEKKKASKQIRIQQVREVEDFFYVGSHRGGARVCLIDPAEAMNAVTANALLKILEEPSPSFYFIMISHRWRMLLPTLLSRSRRVMFGRPDPARASAWLAARNISEHARWLPFFGQAPMEIADAAQGGRLKALDSLIGDLHKPLDPLAQAQRWEALVKAEGGVGMEDVVTTVQKWLHDLGQRAVGAPARYFPSAALDKLLPRLSLPALLQAERQMRQMRGLAGHPLNPRLFLEDLCLRAFRPLGL